MFTSKLQAMIAAAALALMAPMSGQAQSWDLPTAYAPTNFHTANIEKFSAGVKQATGGQWQQIGEEISEKLDYTPSSLFVRRIVRPKYVVRFPDTNQPDELRIAELPPEVLPKSKAAPGLVADVIVSKLVDHLPLYRQEQRYARQGFPIARSTSVKLGGGASGSSASTSTTVSIALM